MIVPKSVLHLTRKMETKLVETSQESTGSVQSVDPSSNLEGSEKSSVTVPKNTENVICSHCPSKILIPGSAIHIRKKVFLPNITSKAAIPRVAVPSSTTESDDGVLYIFPGVEGEVLEDFWMVTDMFTFENVGVSNTVGTLKYLTCADCELGPIGYHDVSNQEEYFVAWNRVRNL